MPYPDSPIPGDEQERQRALERYGVLDSETDDHLQRLVRLVARVMETPTALISLVDGDRQWFLARHGLDATETPRQMAFCAHAICAEEALVVPDARLDPRFCTNPLVTGPPAIRFYAGAVLQSPEGHNLGTLCVIDQTPRRLSRFQVDTLQDLAQLVLRELELRRLATLCATTGALRRDTFLAQVRRELQRCAARSCAVALLLLDLDQFELINRNWGMQAGDRVLRAVAETCQAALRPGELLGRLGDDTFALLLLQVDADEARLRAEGLRQEIGALQGVFSNAGHRLRLSGGLSLAAAGETALEPLLGRGERALALAQTNGRDQIALVLGEPVEPAPDPAGWAGSRDPAPRFRHP
jgi:diguanylate cyclase (GGDEF)-like protein